MAVDSGALVEPKGTLRQQIIDLLMDNSLTALDLSQVVRIPEKDVYRHLAHIQKTVSARGKKFIMAPSVCLACGFTFDDRRRYTKPGRCPRCRETRVQPPTFKVR